jgi:hypothetical protein
MGEDVESENLRYLVLVIGILNYIIEESKLKMSSRKKIQLIVGI